MKRLPLVVALITLLAGVATYYIFNRQAAAPGFVAPGAPELSVSKVADNLDHPWDTQFLPDKTMLITERKGRLSRLDNGTVKTIADVPDVHSVGGEGGLLSMAVDPSFSTDRTVYFCHNSQSGGDERITSYTLSDAYDVLQSPKVILSGITVNPKTRHSGCRLQFGPDGYLWVGTGDAALPGDLPQNPKSLNGKILRITTSGEAAPGNPGGDLDPRIFSYGHRNAQGIAFFETPRDGLAGISVEHGSNVDDEVNPLRTGNFGWSPPQDSYDERNVPMTDMKRFPDAVSPIWRSGRPTIAPSGAAIIRGNEWKTWNGAVVVGVLKARQLRIMHLDRNNRLSGQETILKDTYGRLRSVTQGADGSLFITTDNGKNTDVILKLQPLTKP